MYYRKLSVWFHSELCMGVNVLIVSQGNLECYFPFQEHRREPEWDIFLHGMTRYTWLHTNQKYKASP